MLEEMPARLLAAARRILGFELALRHWLSVATVLAAPYLLIGLLWTATHTGPLRELSGIDLAVSAAGSIALWPVLLLSHVCLG